MKKYFVYLLMLLIIVPCILANAEFIEWGFGSRIIGVAERGNYWASSLENGAYPTLNVSIAVLSVDLPTVVDLDSDGINEIFFYTSTGVLMYNNHGQYLSSYSAKHISRRGTVSSQNGTNNIYLLVNEGSDYYIDIIKKTSDVMQRQDRFNITDRDYLGFIYSNINIYVPDQSFNVSMFDRANGTLIATSTEGNASLIYKTSGTFNITYANPMIVGDLNRDGSDEFAYIFKSATGAQQPFISYYDTASMSFISRKRPIGGINNPALGVLGTGSVGSSSNPPIFTVTLQSSTTSAQVTAYDLSLSQLYSSGVFDTASFIATSFIGDEDSDGFNEFCYFDRNLGILCYGPSFALKHTLNVGISPNDGWISAGKYVNDNFIDILTDTEWITRNTTNSSKWFKVANFASGHENPIPVVISDRTNFVKDILLVGKATSVIYFSSQLASTCGNGICDSGENALNCPEDCSLSVPTEPVITEAFINPCNTITWKQNTSVQVTAKSETLDSHDVNITAIIYGGTSNEQKSSSGFIASGSTALFNFVANLSCSGCSVSVFSESTEGLFSETISFPFTTGASGISFGDSSCGITQPLEQVIANTNTTGTSDNAISGTANLFAGMTGLSATVIYIFMMFIVGIACFVFGLYNGMKANLVFMIVIVLETLLLIIGVIPPISIIPIGVLIVLVLVFAVIIAMWLRSIFTGSGDGSQPGG